MASCQVVNQGTDIFSFEDPAVKSDIKVQACGVRRLCGWLLTGAMKIHGENDKSKLINVAVL